MSWDDIRIFVSVSNEKSFSRAAKKHNTTQATISRRIQNLEQLIGQKLFHRGQGGCELTSQGYGLLEYANEMMSWANAFEAKAKNTNNRDRIVVITCGAMLAHYLSANLSQLYDNFTNVNIEIRATPELLSIEKGEADIALRNIRPIAGQLKIRKLDLNNFLDYYVYGNKESFSNLKITDKNEFKNYWWASYTKNMSNLSSAKWLKKYVENKKIKYRVNSSSLLIDTLKNNDILTILPHFIGHTSDSLISTYGPIDDLKPDLWLIRRNEVDDQLIRDVSNNIEKVLKNYK